MIKIQFPKKCLMFAITEWTTSKQIWEIACQRPLWIPWWGLVWWRNSKAKPSTPSISRKLLKHTSRSTEDVMSDDWWSSLTFFMFYPCTYLHIVILEHHHTVWNKLQFTSSLYFIFVEYQLITQKKLKIVAKIVFLLKLNR